MKKSTTAWQARLPGGLPASAFSLDELRAAKSTHRFLTGDIPGPPHIAETIRAFRYLMFFGIACIAEDKYPPLTRCWKELDSLFMHDPAFDDGVFVQSWVLLDFPFGPNGDTVLDYFERFLASPGSIEGGPRWQSFIKAARGSRLGLYQDVRRTKTAGQFRDLFTGRELSAFRSVDEYGQGEIFLTRMMPAGDQLFMFGNPKCFPRERKHQIEEMVLDKVCCFDPGLSPAADYEAFMKLAGPYWMSCVTSDQDAPILAPDHYLTYLAAEA
jgi:hypothetical protein